MEASSPFPCAPCPDTVTVRRNPPRKVRATPSSNVLKASSLPSSSSTLKTIPSFPVQDILSVEIAQNVKSNPSSSTEPQVVENLGVFLRIRPHLVQTSRKVTKNAWPQNPKTKNFNKEKVKKKSGVCITVNDSRSVTLSPPSHLLESKRVSSEVYEGFSHVFSAESSQDEVYEKMVKGLVEDFLQGKSGMLAALGPSGSGKTYTVFGCPREPGMVPLILSQIFKQTEDSDYGSSRSFFLSIFEIYSEKGKGERIIDLSPNDAELQLHVLRASAVKGVQEVLISDTMMAESIIARGMLKRATAMTNSNFQSSRSQCIISIRSAPRHFVKDDGVEVNNAVLTIVDLAGAEREKKTGNQGARLLESNFINNTSMVFCLCLRSLLEQQKNPKKPLQRHFQNSLLTRYLRDYLEGKKRMTLILTVKPGEEDYLDTSFLLRQSSTYMKIKFSSAVEAPPNLLCNKRQFPSLSRVKQPKRMKSFSPDAILGEEEKIPKNEEKTLEEEVVAKELKEVVSSGKIVNASLSDKLECSGHVKGDNYCLIMQNLARAMWNVLKEYKNKLKESSNEVHSLKENLRNEESRNLDLQKELQDFKSRCSCHSGTSVEVTTVKRRTSSELKTNTYLVIEGDPSAAIQERKLDDNSPDLDAYERTIQRKHHSLGENPNVAASPVNVDTTSDTSVISALVLEDEVDANGGVNVGISSVLEGHVSPKVQECMTKYSERSPIHLKRAEDINDAKYSGTEDNPPNVDITGSNLPELQVSAFQSHIMVKAKNHSSGQPIELQNEESKEIDFERCNIVNGREKEQKFHSCSGCSDTGKPKRRLMPASSVLLRDINLEFEDENEKPKGGRGERKVAADRRFMSQGNISLLHLLGSPR